MLKAKLFVTRNIGTGNIEVLIATGRAFGINLLMHPPTSDLRIHATKPLIAPVSLEGEWPLSDAGAAQIAQARREIAAIVTGTDDRLLVVVWPCSIHDPAAAVEYAERLRDVVLLYTGELLIAIRVYFEKPRTLVGWKGLINDPHLDSSFHINRACASGVSTCSSSSHVACRWRRSFWIRPRPILRRPGLVGRHRCADRREPSASRTRVGAFPAGGFQEPHRR